MLSEELQFKGGNPGAVQYGNFINYYKFHPPEERIKLIPIEILQLNEPYELLDIGCNTGVCCKKLSFKSILIFSL